jgi:hypothetical protein
MQIPLYPLLARTYGFTEADQLMAAAQTPTDAMGTVEPYPAHLQLFRFSSDEMEVTAKVPLRSNLKQSGIVLARVTFPNRVYVHYDCRLVMEHAQLVVGEPIQYVFELVHTPQPMVCAPNGIRLPWRSEDLERLQTMVLAVQEGFASTAKAFQHGAITAEQATRAIQKLTRSIEKPPHIDMLQPVKKTRKIRIE